MYLLLSYKVSKKKKKNKTYVMRVSMVSLLTFNTSKKEEYAKQSFFKGRQTLRKFPISLILFKVYKR